MAAQTFSARAVAVLASKRTGRKVSDKQVRAWARDHVTRLDDDKYTRHEYTAAERDRIVSAFAAASRPNVTGPNARSRAASQGRAKSASKPATAPKPAPKPSKPTTAVPAAPESAS